MLFLQNAWGGNASKLSQQLATNGVSLSDDTKPYTEHQYYLLTSFDFNPYRNFTSRRLVKIEDGPLIELFSISEMVQQGKIIPAKILEDKKDEVVSKDLKPVITLINIGFKYEPAKNTETGY